MKRRRTVAYLAGLGPSVGGARGGVGCGDLQDGSIEELSRHISGDVDADVLVDGKCDGHEWCHKRIAIGHSVRQEHDSLGATSLAASSGLSSRLSVCPPPVRSAPGSSSFPPCVILHPLEHSALRGGHSGARPISFSGVGTLVRPLFAVASVVRPGSFVFVGSSISSRINLYPVVRYHVPSQSVASARRSVEVGQSRRGSVSVQGGCDVVVVASFVAPSVAPIQSSQKVILDRQVIVVDLGLVGPCVIDKVDVGCSVVGQALGRQPPEFPSSLHYVLRLRGGDSTAISLGGNSDGDGDVSGAGSGVLLDAAVGSGSGDDPGVLGDDRGGIVSVASAGVLAKEEGCIDGSVGHAFPIFVEGCRPLPHVDVVFPPFNASPCPNSPEFRSILYDAPSCYVWGCFARFGCPLHSCC